MPKFITEKEPLKNSPVKVDLIIDHEDDVCITYNGIKVAWITADGTIRPLGLEHYEVNTLKLLDIDISSNDTIILMAD